MNNKYIVGIITVVAILLIGGYIVSNSKDDKQVASETGESSSVSEEPADGEAMEKENGDAMMEKDGEEVIKGEAMMEKVEGDVMTKQAGTYQDYSAAKVDSEQAKGNKVVLFFHASWCPTCKTADAAFKANLSSIPDGVTVLKIDYDSNKELRNKYALTYQHTFVQLDNDENKVTSWISGDIAALKTNLK